MLARMLEPSTDANLGLYRHAWTELMLRVLSLVDMDPYWKALYYLYVVAAGILGREQTEEGSGGPGHVLDCAVVVSSESVDMDGYGLARMHAAKLDFFEIRCDPDVIDGDHSQKGLTGLHPMTQFNGLVADHSAHRSVDFRVAQI
jgi:hypothetical protein